MATIIDIYIKLILAVLGFIAPTVTLLFPIFFKGIAIMKERLTIQEGQFERLAQEESEKIEEKFQQVEDLGADVSKVKKKFIKDRTKKQDETINTLRRSLYYFELRSQIKWIFIPLFISLVYVMIYSIIKCNVFNRFEIHEVKHIGEVIILIHSIIFLLTSIWVGVRVKINKFKEKLSSWEIIRNDSWLSITIAACIISVLIYLSVCYNWFNFSTKNIIILIETYILSISLFMFLFTVRRLWLIVCTVIEAKPMLEDNRDQDKPVFSISPVPKKQQ